MEVFENNFPETKKSNQFSRHNNLRFPNLDALKMIINVHFQKLILYIFEPEIENIPKFQSD